MSLIDNARAIEAALQRLQGPPAAGKLLVKATGADLPLHPGTIALPIEGGSIDPGAAVYVRPNPATADEDENAGAWTVTAAGILVDVEAVQGGPRSSKPGGTSYRWNPPLDGLELVSTAEAAGIVGGEYSEAFAGLRQFSHFKTLTFEAGTTLFQSQTFDYPACVLSWAGTLPLDGAQAGSPGPRTARTAQGKMLYQHTWFLYLATSRLDSSEIRSEEGATLLLDVLEVMQDAKRIRDRSFVVSGEPGASIVSAAPFQLTPSAYVDLVTIRTIFVLERRPEPRTYHDWLRTRLRQQTPALGSDPPLDLPNIIIPMPPNGPGPGPFP